jgi:hypothetical protein
MRAWRTALARRAGTLVQVIGHSVAVAVERTAAGIDSHTPGSAGTFIQIVRHSVAVTVERGGDGRFGYSGKLDQEACGIHCAWLDLTQLVDFFMKPYG